MWRITETRFSRLFWLLFFLQYLLINRLQWDGQMDMTACSVVNGSLRDLLQEQWLKRGKCMNLDQTKKCGKETIQLGVLNMKRSWMILKASTNFLSVSSGWWKDEKDQTYVIYFKIIAALQEDGISLVKKMPPTVDTLNFLCYRIGFPKTTHYGTHFVVKSKQDANNVAYTTNTLDMHTDLPYYLYKPGVQFLHCIEQYNVIGGENEFTDAVFIPWYKLKKESKTTLKKSRSQSIFPHPKSTN